MDKSFNWGLFKTELKLYRICLLIFKIMLIFVYKLFETMQSSVTEGTTFATKSLPVSFKYCNQLLIYSKLHQNIKVIFKKFAFHISRKSYFRFLSCWFKFSMSFASPNPKETTMKEDYLSSVKPIRSSFILRYISCSLRSVSTRNSSS